MEPDVCGTELEQKYRLVRQKVDINILNDYELKF